jgi:hypothetical protein
MDQDHLHVDEVGHEPDFEDVQHQHPPQDPLRHRIQAQRQPGEEDVGSEGEHAQEGQRHAEQHGVRAALDKAGLTLS